MQIKLTNMLREKERKKRKSRYAKLNRHRWRRFIYIKIKCKGKRTVGKANKGVNVEKICLKIEKLKFKKEKRGEKRKKTP